MRGRLWLAGFGLVVPQAAQAQEATPASALPINVSVSERGRPDYDPIGGRIGSFFLYPRLDVTGQYTSNLRAAEDGAISDVLLDLRPSARLVSLWSRHSLEATAYYDHNIHARYSSEDVSSYGLSTIGRYDVGRGAIGITVGAAKTAEPRGDINTNLASRTPISVTSLNLATNVTQEFNRLSLTAYGSVAKQTYEDGIGYDGTLLPQGYRDNVNLSGTVEAGLLIGAGTRAIARVQTGAIRYDTNPYGGFDRNSESYRIEGGVSLTINTLLSGSATIGYYRQNNDDPLFIDSSGLSFSANLLYNPTALMSVRLYADRSVEPGGSTVTAGNIRSTGRVTVEYGLRPNLLLSGSASYSHIDPQGDLDSADEYSVSASAVYYINRRYRVTAGAGYSGRQSDYFSEYSAVTGSIGVVVTL